MAESATHTTTISGSPETCFRVATDFGLYPLWARDVKDTKVVATDDHGRALDVEFRASALGRSTHYTLHYDYTGAPERMSWKLTSGDLMRVCDGSYAFLPSATVAGGTDVVYELSIELVVPLPGFVKRRAEVRILNTVNELKSRVEALGA